MSHRRILGWAAVYVFSGLALLGFFVFLIGLFVDFIASRAEPLPESLSPTIQVALAGLCLSGTMAILGFTLVGVLLARQTRKQAPGYGDAYRLIERLQFNQAIPVLERAVRSGHETSDVLMLLTNAYANTGQLAKAQAIADRAVELYPQDPGAYVTLASGYRVQASYEEAARALQKAAELAPEQPLVWAELGFVQHLAGEREAALQAFEQAAQYPMPAMYGVRVYHHLARAYQQAGKTEEAMRAIAKMMSARDGVEAWKPIQASLEGTAYGQSLRYEIASIEEALGDADAARLS